MASVPSSFRSYYPGEGSTTDEISMKQSIIFSDSLKDMRNIKAQLYSAAKYFESSYIASNKKQLVMSTLKDYTAKALFNTIDHMGSVTDKVNEVLEEKMEEIAKTELQISCFEQKIRSWEEHAAGWGLSRQTFAMETPKYHRHYVIPENGKGYVGLFNQEDHVHGAPSGIVIRSRYRDESPPKFRKSCSLPPGSATFSFSEKEKTSMSPPAPSLGHEFAYSSAPSTPISLVQARRTYSSEPRRYSLMGRKNRAEIQNEMERIARKWKRVITSLLGRRGKGKKDLLESLDEY